MGILITTLSGPDKAQQRLGTTKKPSCKDELLLVYGDIIFPKNTIENKV